MEDSDTAVYGCSPFKDAMVKLKPHIHCNFLHARFHIILQILFPAEKLRHFAAVKQHVGAEEHEPEQHVPAEIEQAFTVAEVRAVDEGPRRPAAHDLDAVDGRAQVLVVALHDAHVAADEDEFARPLLLVREHLPDALLHLLLHLVRAFALLLLRHGALDARARAVVAARVRSHERRGSEDVRVIDAPAADDLADRLVVERHQAFPEQAVLMPELRLHLHVEAVVDQDQLRLAGW